MKFHNLYVWPLAVIIIALISVQSAMTNPTAKLNVGFAQDPRIINGTAALWNNTQHQVSIRYRAIDETIFGYGHSCGGSLISENVVLSAAHCFIDDDVNDGSFAPITDYIVVMGNLDITVKNNNTLIYDIKEVVKYNNFFNLETFNDDIVLVILNASVPVDHPTVKPITLYDGPLEDGTGCYVTGWGLTEKGVISKTLLTVDVPIIAYDKCREQTAYNDSIHEGMLCAGYLQGQRDACTGDSGGPLVCRGSQAGIVSWGEGCAEADRPGVYTQVSLYRHWILSKVAEYKSAMPQFVVYGNNSNTCTCGNVGDGSMSTYSGSVVLMIVMAVASALFSKF